jgi:hypothetical protein
LQAFEMKNRLLAVVAAAEALTGLALIVCPSIVIKLLFGADIADIGVVMSRFAGPALIALGVVRGPCRLVSHALYGMLTYSSLTTLGLLYLALSGKWNGQLLWPAVVLHGGPDTASRAGLVQATGQSNITTG